MTPSANTKSADPSATGTTTTPDLLVTLSTDFVEVHIIKSLSIIAVIPSPSVSLDSLTIPTVSVFAIPPPIARLAVGSSRIVQLIGWTFIDPIPPKT
ncbi:hypothetical protein Ab1vBOLIVR5_gp111 [Agrobacterium phage OLIVR5]|uniref:Uncharacterized protein n=1 Tax=Agrobacterium phage OLIVR5 TaxID=2723773 RepID=A0A858MT39_9CAUD|nr:hypothetical protein KNU99_gp111 [Agrobacterium phage OLIVR5]QIW87759.1 hypothetical protein Ab1vBOLIVR5_gp111 [Agrobacterium phage OLIVR5]QIW88021.1 hypothetical protein Ab1vBOLIVR6_gp114 [Agrobacterium phage OLIVR6]